MTTKYASVAQLKALGFELQEAGLVGIDETLRDIERDCENIMDGKYSEDQTHRMIEVLANCVKGLAVAVRLLNQNKQER